jgi:hypothetical protein
MATAQDASVGGAIETTYGTGVTPSRWWEFTDEDLDWDKTVVQGAGLRVGSRVARSGRRVVPAAMGSGSHTMECVSKGMGWLWQLALGAGTSTLVSGTTYQQVFTLGDTPPSATIQKGMPEFGGTVDAETFLGCMVSSLDIEAANNAIVTAKFTYDIKDLTTATSYAAPSYATSPSLFHFAEGSLYSGTLTSPTSTTLASAVTQIADVRDFSLTVDNNLSGSRFNFGNNGRKSKPTVGLRGITGKMTAEYDVTTWRDAVLNETPMALVLTFQTGVALSSGVETLQIVLPEVKFDSELPKTNGTDNITQSMAFTALDNLTAAQPIWIACRTSDAAL